jgi:hypothetical protein
MYVYNGAWKYDGEYFDKLWLLVTEYLNQWFGLFIKRQ